MIYRPQSKRVKEHKNLMASMSKGDEVLTGGGLVGKITQIAEENDFIVIALNDNNEVTIKKRLRDGSTAQRYYPVSLIFATIKDACCAKPLSFVEVHHGANSFGYWHRVCASQFIR